MTSEPYPEQPAAPRLILQNETPARRSSRFGRPGSRLGTRLALDVFSYIVLSFGAVTMLIPFLWMVSVSFRIPAEQYSRSLIPNPFTLQNYIDLWRDLPDQAFPYLMFNSFKLGILMVIGQ